jgi:hypothetical protein
MGLAKFWIAPNAAVISKKNRKQSQTARTRRKSKIDPAGFSACSWYSLTGSASA